MFNTLRIVRFTALIIAVAAISAACGGSSAPMVVDHKFEIPSDATERLNRGEKIQLLPQVLEVHVGDTMTIINNDREAQSFGPFFVGAGERLSQAFKSEALLEGDCTFTGDGTYTIKVLPARK